VPHRSLLSSERVSVSVASVERVAMILGGTESDQPRSMIRLDGQMMTRTLLVAAIRRATRLAVAIDGRGSPTQDVALLRVRAPSTRVTGRSSRQRSRSL